MRQGWVFRALHDRIVWVGLLTMLLLGGVAIAAGAAAGPLAPPTLEQIQCITVDMDGAQFYHVDLIRPATSKGEIMAAFVRLGQDVELRGRITGEQRLISDGRRIVETATRAGSDYTAGRVCYVLMSYCDPSCTGNGCATIRVPSIK